MHASRPVAATLVTPALAALASLAFGIGSGAAAPASPSPHASSYPGYAASGYHHKGYSSTPTPSLFRRTESPSPSPSQSRSRSRTPSPSPSPRLPNTGTPTGGFVFFGVVTMAIGIGMLVIARFTRRR